MSETHTRTIARMISYRLTAWGLTVGLAYIMLGDISKALEGSTILHVILTLDYYIHERIWLKIKWGKL
jgi:adenylylsulfate kinase